MAIKDKVFIELITETKKGQDNLLKYAAVAAGVTLALTAIYKAGKKLIDLYAIQERAEIKLAAAIKATGGAVGISKDQMLKMATALQGVTTYADEAIITAQALLVTFTQIGKEVFPDALEAALDMSAMFDQDLKQSVLSLGKALNDPITGVGRLMEVGVSFTIEQKKSIKVFMEQNDVMSAQRVILEELKNEFGGVAKAMAEGATGPWEQMKNTARDLAQEYGEILAKDFGPLVKYFRDLAQASKEAREETERLQKALDVGIAISILMPLSEMKEALELRQKAMKGYVAIFGKEQWMMAEQIAQLEVWISGRESASGVVDELAAAKLKAAEIDLKLFTKEEEMAAFRLEQMEPRERELKLLQETINEHITLRDTLDSTSDEYKKMEGFIVELAAVRSKLIEETLEEEARIREEEMAAMLEAGRTKEEIEEKYSNLLKSEYQQRLIAVDKFYGAEIGRAIEVEASIVDIIKAQDAEKLSIKKEYAEKVKELIESASQTYVEAIGKRLDLESEYHQAISSGKEKELLQLGAHYKKLWQMAVDLGKDTTELVESFDREKLAIDQKYNDKAIALAFEYVDAVTDIIGELGNYWSTFYDSRIDKLEKFYGELTQAELDYNDFLAEERVELTQAEKDYNIHLQELADARYAAMTDEEKYAHDLKQAAIDSRIEEDERYEDEKEKLKVAADAAELKREQDLAVAIAGIERKEAIAAKAIALFEIAVNTAKAISGVLKTPWLIPFIAGLGLAQAATVAATPLPTIPTFAQGGQFTTTDDQYIRVGDNAGGRERVTVEPLSSPGYREGDEMMHVVINLDGKTFADFVTRASRNKKINIYSGSII